jgi:hypothetical protein
MAKKFKRRDKGQGPNARAQVITDSVILACAPFLLNGYDARDVGSGLIHALETFVVVMMGVAHQAGNPPDDILGMPAEIRDVVAKCMDRAGQTYLDEPNFMRDMFQGLMEEK